MTKHKVKEKQYITEMCFGCGKDNHDGLHGAFYSMEDGKAVAFFHPSDRFQSYPQRLHGGITATMLDETLGRAILVLEPDCWAVTAELRIRYKKPVPVNTSLMIVAEVTENNRRLFRCDGELILPDGEVAATARGVYVKQPLTQIVDIGQAEAAVSRVKIPQEKDRDYIEY